MRYKRGMFILCIIVFTCSLITVCLSDDLNSNYLFETEENPNIKSNTGYDSDWIDKQSAIYLDGFGHNLLLLQPVIPKVDSPKENKLGFGYRGVLSDSSILLGVNSIFNFSKDDMFSCQGIGLEAFYQMLEFRASSQSDFSTRHFTNGPGVTGEERAQKYEAEVGLAMPFLNWISLYGGAFWLDYENFSDSEGWKFRGEVRPFKYIVLNLMAYDDGITEYRADGAVSLPFNIFTDNPLRDDFLNVGFSEKAYSDKIDHSFKMLDNFRINE